MPPVLAILVGLLVSLAFASRLAYNKFFCIRYGLEGSDVAFAGQFLLEPIFFILAIVLLATDFFGDRYSLEFLLKDSASAIARGVGVLFMTVAVQYGKGGPAASLALLQTPITALMNALFLA